MLATKTIDDFISQLPKDRQQPIKQLRKAVVDNIPEGFDETINNGMLNYNIPLSIYPQGYHCTENTPLPFVSIASQKNFIALYHMGLYADKDLLKWFQDEYPNHSKYKLNMGKSCIRFKKIDVMPFKIIKLLMEKVTVDAFIKTYENVIKP